MHIVSARRTAVTLFSRTGEVECFTSLEAAFKALGFAWIRGHVGPEFRVFSHTERWLDDGVWHHRRIFDTFGFVMRDDFGATLTATEFAHLVPPRRPWRRRALDAWDGEGPVPGIRKYRGGRHYYRRIRHLNARRNCFTLLEEGEVAPRAARNLHRLPNNWDDHRAAGREDRNWKRFRRQQWKS